MNRRACAAALASAMLGMLASAASAPPQLSETFTNWIDHPAIAYETAPTRDPVAELSRRLEDGRAQLTSDGPSGYLRSLLKALQVPVESQMAVFVPDSVQALRIRATN